MATTDHKLRSIAAVLGVGSLALLGVTACDDGGGEEDTGVEDPGTEENGGMEEDPAQEDPAEEEDTGEM